jgi:hypothetical protein
MPAEPTGRSHTTMHGLAPNASVVVLTIEIDTFTPAEGWSRKMLPAEG